MRRLGPLHNVLRATINLGAQIDATTKNAESTKPPSYWGKLWNEQDVRIMVLISLALQLFLLFAGNVPRRRRVGWLRFLVWLAYLAAYAVVASAIGLFSQYEDKYKIRKIQSPEDIHRVTIPFLWAPVLLIHLGGPDTITAFSLEDNNLWTRQLINLVVQLSLALYVFWKSFDLLDSKLLAVAVPLFVAGIIKYGERIWALKSGSRDSLDDGSQTRHIQEGDPTETLARCSALSSRGLLAGRTLAQLASDDVLDDIVHVFENNGQSTEEKLEFILMELGMIYDMLYTKAMVLQGWTAVFRCVAVLAMVVSYVLFWTNQHMYAQRTTNAAITYTLFVAAISMEIYSIFMVIASPWTSGRYRIIWRMLNKLGHYIPSRGLAIPPMGQFNLPDYCFSRSTWPWFILKVSESLGVEKQCRNFWYTKHIEDKEIVDYVMGLLNLRVGPISSQDLQLGEELQFLLAKPFEHALLKLHIFTEMHLSELGDGDSDEPEMTALVVQCRKLSNYLMYLMAVYPSMLPVSSSVTHDLESDYAKWVWKTHARLMEEIPKSSGSNTTHPRAKKEILKSYAEDNVSPFKETPSIASLMDIKELWARLLIYTAGKCPMELHARQLGKGVELLTVIGSLMIHQGLGNAGMELKLLAPPRAQPDPPECVLFNQFGEGVAVGVKVEPSYAFEFLEVSDDDVSQPMYVRAWSKHTSDVDMNTSTGSDVAPEIEQAFASRKLMGIRHRAVSGAVQSPQGQIQRSLSF